METTAASWNTESLFKKYVFHEIDDGSGKMNLKGQTVIHKVFGEGMIKNHGDKYLTISFQGKDKKFTYPGAFKGYLKVKDTAVDKAIHLELNAIEKEKIRIQEEHEARVAEVSQRISEQTPIRTEIIKSTPPKKSKIQKANSRYNIAFKCNYCDGGKSPEQIGFNGVCSDAIINNNIEVEKRAWCSDKDCACRAYHDGEINRYELEKAMIAPEFPCYESQMLRDWRAFAGGVLTGKNKGKPKKLLHVQSYSLCVLTTRDPNVRQESERYIFAVFLVDETYEGDNREAGHVTTSSEYKIKLSPEEAHAMPFWKYHANENSPGKPVWGQGLHRYVKDEEAAFILRDIAVIKQNTKDEHLANIFYKYFCRKNEISLSPHAEPNGALYRK